MVTKSKIQDLERRHGTQGGLIGNQEGHVGAIVENFAATVLKAVAENALGPTLAIVQ